MPLQQAFLKILSCPLKWCRGDFLEVDDQNENYLVCSDCKTKYPIIEGIPILFPQSKYAPDIHKRHWDEERNAKSYAKKYDKYLKKQGSPWGLYTHVSEINAIKKLTKGIDLTGKTILDLGCGNGRLLSVYPEAGVKIGIDSSFYLLQATKRREPDFWLVCGQVEDLPFKDAIADFSVSIRVLQHLRVPEHAISEMVRITKPSGYVALEVYNKLNPKEVYKRFRMLKTVDKFWPWGLSYDRYYSFREIEKWFSDTFVNPIKYAGAGWGIHFYLFEPLRFRFIAPKNLQKAVFNFFLKLENIVGTLPYFSKSMEKIAVIGSVQHKKKSKIFFEKIVVKAKIRKSLVRAKEFQKRLEERNYAFTGSDRHHLGLCVDWLKRAQDATPDGGVSRGYGLVWSNKFKKSGWQPSYPETTGYIIPTMLQVGEAMHDEELIKRAHFMGRWLLAIMNSDGSVQGGNIQTKPKPAVFDTGQVIRGLFAFYKKSFDNRYLQASLKASEWLLKHENANKGNWIRDNALGVSQKATIYNVYAMVPVIKLGLHIGNNELISLGKRVGNFTKNMQTDSGWFKDCDFYEKDDVLLHTLAYTIDGLWDVGNLLHESEFLMSSKKALDGVISQMDKKGNIPGRFNEYWQGTVTWACLTGISQIAVTAMKVYKQTNEEKYLKAGVRAKEFLKTCQNNFDEEAGGGLGAVWGSWPIAGVYGRFEALNWAVKYFADLLLLCDKERNLHV